MKALDIGELARRAGIPPSALRFYEKKGLIKPIGRSGLRRQYSDTVLIKLQLIAAGQLAGFTLDEMAEMFGEPEQRNIDRHKLLARADEIDATVLQLQMLSQGLRHVAKCKEEDHTRCEEFRRVLRRGLRLVKRAAAGKTNQQLTARGPTPKT